jgi:hypothetical protein
MHQSVVGYDVAPPTMIAVSVGTRITSRVTRRDGANKNGLRGPRTNTVPRNSIVESVVSYLTVVGIAFGLVTAWAALCAI